MITYTPHKWFWSVAGDKDRYWSSADREYVDRLPKGAGLSRIATEAELWEVLAQQAPQCLPVTDAAQDARKERELGKADQVLFKIAFRQENRLRVLEGKSEVSGAQFRRAVKSLI